MFVVDLIQKIPDDTHDRGTKAGEREVQKALRKILLKYKLHKEQDLFDRAYGYIKQYY